MPLYCIVGQVKSVEASETHSQWPVCYRMDPSDANTVVITCQHQRDGVATELEGIAERRDRKPRDPGRTAKRHEQGQYKLALAEWQKQSRELDAEEAAVTARWSPELLDPLLPLGGDGSYQRDIEYRILVFWEDPREMGEAELMKLRASIHGGLSGYQIDGDQYED